MSMEEEQQRNSKNGEVSMDTDLTEDQMLAQAMAMSMEQVIKLFNY